MKKSKRETRSDAVLVRLKPSERSRIEAKAKARGLGVSAWIRMAALDALAKDV